MSLIGSAVAQTVSEGTPTPVPPTTVGTLIETVAPMLLIFVVFYFFMIRPQQKRAAAHRAKIESVKRGDTIVTAGGILGKIVHVREQEVEVEIAPDVRVKVVKSTIADIATKAP